MGNSRLGYWRIANSPILAMAFNNNCLRKAGYATLMASYLEWHPKVGTAVCGTARTVVWEVGKCESRGREGAAARRSIERS